MWTINASPISHSWLEFEPVTVIDEYDGPRLFTLAGEAGLYLAYFCARSVDGVRFLVVPTSDGVVADLTHGRIDLREALSKPRMWVFDLDKKWTPVRCWRVTAEDLPRKLLPKPGVMLRAGMRPVTKSSVAQSISNGKDVARRFPCPPTAVRCS